MKLQNFEEKTKRIQENFKKKKKENPKCFQRRLNLSWSNWGFGMESLDVSLARLKKAGINFVEIHGNHYGPDLGYKMEYVKSVLNDYDMTTSGICGMFSSDNDLASNRGINRQEAIDYIRRELNFSKEVGADYMLIVPAAVGRPNAYDDMEFERSVESIRLVADLFTNYDVKAAIEPIRSAEVSIVHTVSDAIKYIDAVNHPGVSHINGDVYHMQSEESHIGEAILEAGGKLVNLHMADSNRCALGEGSLDLDTIIMALYLISFNQEGRYVSPEPLGPGGDPYPAMHGKPDPKRLDAMVNQTASYFREREEALLSDS